MDESNTSADLISTSKHQRVIVHIDVDCFYAQVEILKDPKLKDLPVGVRQKNIVVTSNYVAREYAIKKCMLVTEALKLCPGLILVSGEDLQDYRKMSCQITSALQKFSPLVEKLGLDENFVDITEMVTKRLTNDECTNASVEGHSYADDPSPCECGCHARLCMGSHIASEMRKALQEELNITTCAGVSYNKLLAKLAGSTHKPNQQTTLLPSGVSKLLLSLKSVRCLPGIGETMSRLLLAHSISTIPELQNATLPSLQQFLGKETALRYKKLCFGIDDSPVKASGKPSSLGLEDGFRKISLESEVRDKFSILLQRLMKLLADDGRVPRSVKVTVRKYDGSTKQSHKESRQCNVGHFFPCSYTPTKTTIHMVLGSVMQLFHKIVDISKPFHLTLLGVSFSKFVDRASGKSSIASFLQKDVSIQTITNIKSEPLSDGNRMDFSPKNDSGLRTPTSHLSSNNSGSESDVEPSPKKIRKMLWANKRKRLSDDTDEDSPSKLRVSELHLSSPVTSRASKELDHDISNLRVSSPVQFQTCRDRQRDSPELQTCLPELSAGATSLSPGQATFSSSEAIESLHRQIPQNVDQSVFKQLPPEVQEELLAGWESKESVARAVVSKSRLLNSGLRKNTLHQYFRHASQK